MMVEERVMGKGEGLQALPEEEKEVEMMEQGNWMFD